MISHKGFVFLSQREDPPFRFQSAPMGDLQGALHDLIRRIPGIFNGNEVLPDFLSLIVTLKHTELLSHGDGERMIGAGAPSGTFAQN